MPPRRSTTRTPLAERREARKFRKNLDGVLLAFPWRTPEGKPGEVRVVLRPYNGRSVLHVRSYERGPKGVWVATPRGVTLPATRIRDVIAALEEAHHELLAEHDERGFEDVLEDGGYDLPDDSG